jgi:hypothetical protein
LDLRQLAQRLFGGLTYRGERKTRLLEEGRSNAGLLIEHSEQQVFDIHALMASAYGMGGSRLEGFLKLDRHPIHIHAGPLVFSAFLSVPT